MRNLLKRLDTEGRPTAVVANTDVCTGTVVASAEACIGAVTCKWGGGKCGRDGESRGREGSGAMMVGVLCGPGGRTMGISCDLASTGD